MRLVVTIRLILKKSSHLKTWICNQGKALLPETWHSWHQKGHRRKVLKSSVHSTKGIKKIYKPPGRNYFTLREHSWRDLLSVKRSCRWSRKVLSCFPSTEHRRLFLVLVLHQSQDRLKNITCCHCLWFQRRYFISLQAQIWLERDLILVLPCSVRCFSRNRWETRQDYLMPIIAEIMCSFRPSSRWPHQTSVLPLVILEW